MSGTGGWRYVCASVPGVAHLADGLGCQDASAAHWLQPLDADSTLLLAVAAWTGAIGQDLWLGMLQLGPWQLHPLVLVYALSGSLMISKTLRIPKP